MGGVRWPIIMYIYYFGCFAIDCPKPDTLTALLAKLDVRFSV